MLEVSPALLVAFPTPVAHGGNPQDHAGSSAGDCDSAALASLLPRGDAKSERASPEGKRAEGNLPLKEWDFGCKRFIPHFVPLLYETLTL
jgi:hypothetical protein